MRLARTFALTAVLLLVQACGDEDGDDPPVTSERHVTTERVVACLPPGASQDDSFRLLSDWVDASAGLPGVVSAGMANGGIGVWFEEDIEPGDRARALAVLRELDGVVRVRPEDDGCP